MPRRGDGASADSSPRAWVSPPVHADGPASACSCQEAASSKDGSGSPYAPEGPEEANGDGAGVP
ncbi:hypothetical protein SBADM41S_04395 [Streptomyces badius]